MISDKRKKNNIFLVECRKKRAMDFILSDDLLTYDGGARRLNQIR
jgi:hypothetical protein